MLSHCTGRPWLLLIVCAIARSIFSAIDLLHVEVDYLKLFPSLDYTFMMQTLVQLITTTMEFQGVHLEIIVIFLYPN